MPIERVGQFIEFMVPGENGGIRALARISAIQLVSETDCLGDEILLSCGGRTLLVGATLDQMREILVETSKTRMSAEGRSIAGVCIGANCRAVAE